MYLSLKSQNQRKKLTDVAFNTFFYEKKNHMTHSDAPSNILISSCSRRINNNPHATYFSACVRLEANSLCSVKPSHPSAPEKLVTEINVTSC